VLDGRKASPIFTDPSYNVTIDSNVGGKGPIHHRAFATGCGEMTSMAFTSFLTQTFQHLAAHSQDGSIHYICMDWRHMQEMLASGYEVYSELKNVCVWNKSNGGMGTFYRSKHELVFVWKSGTAAHLNFELGQHGRNRTNVWDYAGVNTFRSGRMNELQMHLTVKPVALVVDAIKDCSKQADIVLDPFCGSGTILVAAERTGRKARALEIDLAYVDVAIRRWAQLTGKSATLSTGGTFEEITEQRTVSSLGREQIQSRLVRRTAVEFRNGSGEFRLRRNGSEQCDRRVDLRSSGLPKISKMVQIVLAVEVAAPWWPTNYSA
jgi:hypothetical protein